MPLLIVFSLNWDTTSKSFTEIYTKVRSRLIITLSKKITSEKNHFRVPTYFSEMVHNHELIIKDHHNIKANSPYQSKDCASQNFKFSRNLFWILK